MNDPTPTPTQRNWRFLHDEPTRLIQMSSYAIRQAVKQAMPEFAQQDIAVRTSEQSVLFSPMTHQANEWMSAHEGALMRTVADLAGQVLPVRPEFAEIAVSDAPVTLYTLPELVVAKKGDWDVWRHDALDEAQRGALIGLIRNGLRDALARWGLAIDGGALQTIRLTSDGKPMPLVKSDGPRSMARLRVQCVAPLGIEGNLFLGGLPMLGYGKLLRGGVVHG